MNVLTTLDPGIPKQPYNNLDLDGVTQVNNYLRRPPVQRRHKDDELLKSNSSIMLTDGDNTGGPDHFASNQHLIYSTQAAAYPY
jgi:hypothetical protein